ncbi:MAG: YifB family Mg chelatase-like AAA ATPase [Candidatus Berkiella sp.]
MSIAVVFSRANVGLDAPLVVVETHLSKGLTQFSLVGLPETAVKESKDRVRSALLQSGFVFPKGRITINLAPADLPKEGGRFDLPIAISILLASKQLHCPDMAKYELAAELALSGELRPIKGILPLALATKNAQRNLIIANPNQAEASWVNDLTVYPFENFLSVCAHLSGKVLQLPLKASTTLEDNTDDGVCMSEICGQHQAKRALEVAAAGGHSLLMVGPPGTGKTMLASRLNTILPPLTQKEALEVASLYSISRLGFSQKALAKRPFRQPHHTASAVSLVGGGRTPMPGEVSLAHHGVLFLDELPEFNRHVLEVLREPLESSKVNISRAQGHAVYPAHCQLIAAMNPCPCGYLSDARHNCHCTPEQVQRYRNKISGPLLDRIDMHIEVPSLDPGRLASFHPKQEESTPVIRERVIKAREKQYQRQQHTNAKLSTHEIIAHCKLDSQAQQMLTSALEKLGISARAYHRILKVARTIADLSDSENIQTAHLAQAIQFRKYDREL